LILFFRKMKRIWRAIYLSSKQFSWILEHPIGGVGGYSVHSAAAIGERKSRVPLEDVWYISVVMMDVALHSVICSFRKSYFKWCAIINFRITFIYKYVYIIGCWMDVVHIQFSSAIWFDFDGFDSTLALPSSKSLVRQPAVYRWQQMRFTYKGIESLMLNMQFFYCYPPRQS
jgi:hypothetical protein